MLNHPWKVMCSYYIIIYVPLLYIIFINIILSHEGPRRKKVMKTVDILIYKNQVLQILYYVYNHYLYIHSKMIQ